jgi:hypothetical protein
MQQPQGDHLTGPEVGFGMFGDGGEMVIDLAKLKGCSKFFQLFVTLCGISSKAIV